jgi:hypothetical protein
MRVVFSRVFLRIGAVPVAIFGAGTAPGASINITVTNNQPTGARASDHFVPVRAEFSHLAAEHRRPDHVRRLPDFSRLQRQ